MNRKLLVVDDDKSIRNVLEASFGLLGYQVTTAEDGEKGEQLAREMRPSLIILDVMMPGKNGFTVCRDLKRDQETAKIPVILLTAKNLRADVYWGYDCGADAYVTKPYEPRELETLVEQLITDAEQGCPKMAWTGLPHANQIIKEFHARFEAGGDALLVELAFPEEQRKVFVQKYGQAKFRDLVHATSWKAYEAVREEAPAGAIGQRPNDALILLIHPLESEKVQKMVLLVTKDAIEGYYDDKDRAAGGIVVREKSLAKDKKDEEEMFRTVPILKLTWKAIDPD